MSVGGPCLWLPSLPSPVPSPLSALSSHLSSARNSDRFLLRPRAISPRLVPQRKEEPGAPVSASTAVTEMQSAEHKAENTLINSGVPSGMAIAVSPAGKQTSSRTTVNPRLEAAKQDMLPRVKLDISSLNSRDCPTIQPLVGHAGHPGAKDSSCASSHESRDDERDSTVSHDDDKDMMGRDDNMKSPSMDKKKMKRFRLTHNQTRFLMSEFTRQAHPDASQRERLSKEIPGLTPRQVQVWFQNRRAKLKRLTTNDRERILRSRALPADFDTIKVLRTPFDGKLSGVTPAASPGGYAAPNPEFSVLTTFSTDRFPRPNEVDYLVSPSSSVSTAAPYLSSAGQELGPIFRPAASASMTDLHRTTRGDYSVTRSNSLSDTSAHLSGYTGYEMPNRFAPQPTQPGVPYMDRSMEYAVPRYPGMASYDQHQSLEGSVSPTDSRNAHMPYDINTLGSQQQNYSFGMSQLSNQGRRLAMQNPPVSTAPDYRDYAYSHTAAPAGTLPFTQTNPSNINVSTSFATDSSAKFGNLSYSYASYISQ